MDDHPSQLPAPFGHKEYSHTATWSDGPGSTRSVTCYDRSQMVAIQKAEMEAAALRGRALDPHPSAFDLFRLFGL